MAYKKVKVDGVYITKFEDKARMIWTKIYRYLMKFSSGIKYIENLSLNTNENSAKFKIYVSNDEAIWRKVITYLKKNNIEYMSMSGGEIVVIIRK